MKRASTVLFVGLILAGCHSATPPPKQDQSASDLSKMLQNDRLKRTETGISALVVDPDGSLGADGMWIPEPDDHAHQLAFPEQTRITCNKGAEYCMEMQIQFVSTGSLITAKGPEETLWPIKSWDKHSLLAEYGPFNFGPLSDQCHSHVLSIIFASQTVTTSDIPTQGKGCEAFKDTNSYRLAAGWYSIDTSPSNNAISATGPK
jgi:hypothetical protein